MGVIKCSLPKSFNKDIIEILTEKNKNEDLFNWLKKQPFTKHSQKYQTLPHLLRNDSLIQQITKPVTYRETPFYWPRLYQGVPRVHTRVRIRRLRTKVEQAAFL